MILEEPDASDFPRPCRAVYSIRSRMNHSCNPNIWFWNIAEKNSLKAPLGFALRDIKKGEELCWNYQQNCDEFSAFTRAERAEVLDEEADIEECRCELCRAGAPPAPAEAVGEGGETKKKTGNGDHHAAAADAMRQTFAAKWGRLLVSWGRKLGLRVMEEDSEEPNDPASLNPGNMTKKEVRQALSEIAEVLKMLQVVWRGRGRSRGFFSVEEFYPSKWCVIAVLATERRLHFEQ